MSGQAAGNEGRSGTIVEAQEKGSELVSRAQEEVQEKTAELRVEAGSRLREQIDSRSTEVGRQIQSVGEALNRSSDQLRTKHEDMPAELLDQVARRAEEFGGYLESVNADRMLSDIEDFARRRPWLAASAGLLAGFVASRFLKASSERRYESSASSRYTSTPAGELQPGSV